MQLCKAIGSFCVALLATASAGAAQDDNSWEVFGTFYLWAAETDSTITTPTRTIESTLPFSDALENLDFAFMGALEARRGRWSLIGDYMLTDLSFGSPTPGPVFGGLDTDVKLQVFNAYALYQATESEDVRVDVGAGLRWVDVDTTLTLLPGIGAGATAGANEDWIDPLLAARVQFRMNEKWTGAVFVDYGGFSSESETWQALITARYAINDQWSIVGGYRHLHVSHDIGANSLEIEQSGPVFGASYKF